MSRHALELEQSLTHDKEKGKALNCLVKVREEDIHPKHPINHLDTILSNIEKKARESNKGYPVQKKGNVDQLLLEKHTKKEMRRMNRTGSHNCEQECYGCPLKKWELVNKKETLCIHKHKNNTFTVNIQEDEKEIEDIPQYVIERNRLTYDMIKDMPRFKNYTEGLSSNVSTIFNE